jgi:tetratricopeptide (TPR) repeat protein
VIYNNLLWFEKKYEEVVAKTSSLLAENATEESHLKLRLYWFKGRAQESIGDYRSALDTIFEALLTPNLDFSSSLIGSEIVSIFLLKLHCCFHVGDFEGVFVVSKQILQFGRCRNNLYEYVAYSYREFGHWDEALATMKKGIRYPQPWNPAVKKKYEDLYEELLKQKERLKGANLDK